MDLIAFLSFFRRKTGNPRQVPITNLRHGAGLPCAHTRYGDLLNTALACMRNGLAGVPNEELVLPELLEMPDECGMEQNRIVEFIGGHVREFRLPTVF